MYYFFMSISSRRLIVINLSRRGRICTYIDRFMRSGFSLIKLRVQKVTVSVLNYFDPNYTVWGPYHNKKQNRNFVTLRHKATLKTTQKTYAKFLMENHLQRTLLRSEEVDHIDRDCTNDVLSNLQILGSGQHKEKDSLKAKLVTLPCAYCAKAITRKAKYIRSRAKLGYRGPFCNQSCSGKARSDDLPLQPMIASELYYPADDTTSK